MMRRSIFAVLAVVLIVGIFWDQAAAIPAFARKYQFSCTTCHSPFPKLKEFGEDFAGNGFRLPEKEPKRYYYDVGDPNLLLMRRLPIAVRVDLYATANDKTDPKSELRTPYNMKILSGGNIFKNIGYYFYFYLSEHGEVVGIEDAYVHFDNLFGKELDLMVGQFQVSDPLFKRELRLTVADYMAYKTYGLGAFGLLTYDRGIMVTYSTDFGTDLAAELVNGVGLRKGPFDTDGYKNLFLRASQNLWGQRIGGFTYNGKASNISQASDLSISTWGVDASFFLPRVEVNVQYLERQEKFQGVSDTQIAGGFVEAIATLNNRTNLTLLYNRLYGNVRSYFLRDANSFTVNLSYLLKTNVRLLAEFTHAYILDKNVGTIGMVVGF